MRQVVCPIEVRAGRDFQRRCRPVADVQPQTPAPCASLLAAPVDVEADGDRFPAVALDTDGFIVGRGPEHRGPATGCPIVLRAPEQADAREHRPVVLQLDIAEHVDAVSLDVLREIPRVPLGDPRKRRRAGTCRDCAAGRRRGCPRDPPAVKPGRSNRSRGSLPTGTR